MYEPLKLYLEKQGYSVSSEVKNCDMVACKDDEMVLIELKVRFSLDLVYQLMERMEMADSVYAAVAVAPGKREIPRLGNVKALLRRLGVGLVLVRFLKSKTRIEVALHPGDYSEKRQHKRRLAILREIDARYAEFNKAGSATSDARFSAYRQRALYLAWQLKKLGPSSPSQLKKSGGPSQSQEILAANFYGWFEKIKRGVYGLSEAGQVALKNYKKQLTEIVKAAEEKASDRGVPIS